jgi:hypothetical protein
VNKSKKRLAFREALFLFAERLACAVFGGKPMLWFMLFLENPKRALGQISQPIHHRIDQTHALVTK